MSKAKANVSAPAPQPSKKTFDPKAYVKNGLAEEEVTSVKTAFDLFDTDQGGSVDIKGNSQINQN